LTTSYPPVSPSPVWHPHGHPIVPESRVHLSWGSCSLETPLRRVPLLTRPAVGPTGRARSATSSPEPSSGFLPLSTVLAVHAARHEPLRSSPLPWHPDASRPCSMPLAPLWSCPSELSLPGEPCPLSRAIASLRVRGRPPPARQRRVFHDAFAAAPALCPRSARRPTETHEPGQQFPAIARPTVRSHCRVAEADRPFSFPPGSPVSGQHARFEALLPPGVRSPATPCPGQGEVATSVLSWAFSSLEIPPRTTLGSVSRVDPHDRVLPGRVDPRELGDLATFARPKLRRLGSRTQDPPAR